MKVSMIYMASGFGRRFGSNKLLAELHGRALYRYGLETLIRAGRRLRQESGIDSRILLVSQYEEILREGEKLEEVVPVKNPVSSQGITASLRLGVEHSPQDTDAYLFFVADQPYVREETVLALVLGCLKGEKRIGCTAFRDRRGNPTVFSGTFRAELLSLTGDRGGSQLIRRYPQELWLCPAQEEELFDLDSPEDFDRMEKGRI